MIGKAPYHPIFLHKKNRTALFQATRLSRLRKNRPVAFRPRLAAGLAFSAADNLCKNYATGFH